VVSSLVDAFGQINRNRLAPGAARYIMMVLVASCAVLPADEWSDPVPAFGRAGDERQRELADSPSAQDCDDHIGNL
jgi:hypothetical protein